MGYRLTFGLILLFICNTYAQYFSSINYPVYVSKNSTFQISFNGAFNDENLEQAYLYLIIDDYIQLNKASFTAGEGYIQIPISLEKNSYGNVNKITLEKNIIRKFKNHPFQILISLKVNDEPNTIINYVWGAISGKKRIVYNSSYVEAKKPNIPSNLNISFYDKGNKAGNMLTIKSGGYFIVPLGNDSKVTLIEFWAKNNSIGSKFSFGFTGESAELFNISLIDYDFLEINKKDDDLLYDNLFIDKYQWYYYTVLINNSENRVKLYVNEKLFHTFRLSDFLKQTDFEFKFSNENGTGIIEIDRLKMWEFEDKIDNVFADKFKSNNYLENSRLICGFNFDETNINKLNGKGNIKFYNSEINVSSAPLYSDLPELNVEVYSGFYTISWQNKNVNSNSFVLERSDNGSNFYEIYRVETKGDENERFNYTDNKTSEGKILFYRLKQIDKFGKYVYTSSVKVGVTAKQIFELKPNFPNPFNPETEICVVMLEDAETEITIYDITGKEIDKIYKGQLTKGMHTFKFDGSEYPSGIYLCKVSSGQALKVQKMILTK